jgi:SpoVK/Ycf46/Vps4 family AAA+-type ATPase
MVLRRSSRGRLDTLAQRIDSEAGWEDLVVPPQTLELLRTLTIQARHRATVYETWGFASRSRRGLGLSALFSGPSGVGKTLAAEVVANELELDLYKIDLSQMVSKYIGETEKNLARVFDAAEAGGVVLLFDEADALFGHRSEVKDSHDRYANIEVSYLLQRMEAFRGIAVLTTNQKSALDSAFMRRIRFVVQFPHPDSGHRALLWKKAFPAAAALANLDIERLARLNLSGGNIRSVALNAAFLAAESREPVGMHHVMQAARAEYLKLERPFSLAEFGGAS